ncbi:MAG: DUF3788 domain-containing protein [Bacteroidetes bacterium]|nr:DUF3788 domain-containing protein [Bacteroidota bacterium]
MIDGNIKPTEDDITKTVGEKSSLWLEIRKYVEENYDFTPELIYYGQKYGWTLRYRKSGKTLCSLFPEKDAFTILVVLGKKEVEKTFSIIDRLNPEARTLFENAEQKRDGRWLWIRVLINDDVESIKVLLNVKRKRTKLS